MLLCVGSPGAVLGTARTRISANCPPCWILVPGIALLSLGNKDWLGPSALHDGLDERK